ncbi:MAG: peptidase, partial [Luteimonas sp.]
MRPIGPESFVSLNKPQVVLLSLAISLALAACKRDATPAAAQTTPAPAEPEAKTLTLDESKLPPVNRFDIADLDTSKNACTDFNGYANSKWLANNKIPNDRTSWGAFEMLDERSVAVQHQLAEQAAADTTATGVEKIVGDFYATGMDQ